MILPPDHPLVRAVAGQLLAAIQTDTDAACGAQGHLYKLGHRAMLVIAEIVSASQPKSFLNERAQLEAEWATLRALQDACKPPTNPL